LILRIFSLSITAILFAALLYATPAIALHKGKYSHISEIKFEHFDSQQGLNQNSITKLFMDSAGMLWIGTQDGLHSYNGVDFQIYLKRSADPETISDNYITDIIQTPDGALWVATLNSGLNRLDLKTGKFIRFNQVDGLTDSQVSHLAVIGDTLWIGTRSGLFMMSLKTYKITSIGLGNSLEPQITSLANIDDKFVIVGTDRVGTYAIDTNTINRLDIPNEMQVNRIQASSIFAVWLAIDNQIWRYNLDTHQKELIWKRSDATGKKNDIKDFIVVDANQVWAIGNGSGLIQLDFDGKEWQSKYHKNQVYKQNSLSEDNLFTMMLDPNGTLWLGTSFSGIDKINLSNQYFTHLFDSSTSNPRKANMIRAIYRDHKQRLWIGTDGKGLKYVTEDGKYTYLNDQFSVLLNIPATELDIQVNDIIEDSEQTVWFATSIGVFTLDKQDTLSQVKPHNPALQADINFRSLAVDDKNRVWLASMLGLYFISKDNQQMLPYNFGFQKEYSPYKHQMLTLHFSDGYLWIGTIGGLVRLNPEEKELVFVSNEPGNPYSLSDNRVRDFLRASNGDLWVATHGGIDKLTTDYGIFKFERLDVNNDLAINTAYSLLEDNDQNLWLGTNSGIARYNPATKKFTSFNIHEGLQALEFNGAARFKDINGDMWFGGINGLNYFTPSDIPQQRPPIKLALTSYTIGNTRYPVLDLSHTPKINMPYEKQLISFEVGALNFSYSNLSQYSYFLTGFDTVWHKLPTGSKITYTNIPPGDYQLIVRHALGQNAFDEKSLVIPISVIPPFYMSKFAYMLYGILSFSLLSYFMYSRHYKHEKQREFEQSIRASEERLKLALWASGDGMWDWNITQNNVYRTNMVPQMSFDHSDKLLIDSIHIEDRARVESLLQEHLDGNSEFFEAEYRVEIDNGKWAWLLDRGQVVERDSKDRPLRMAGTHKDITSRKEIENELKLSSQVLFSMNEAVVVGELDYRVRSVNPAFSRITGFKAREVAGKHFLFLAMGKRSRNFYLAVEAQLLRHKHWAGEIKIRTRNRKGILAWLEINQVIDNKGETSHFVAVFTDITARKKAEEDLRVLANFDPLTGLPNRTLFQDRLNHAITKAHRSEQIVALLFLDLDRFKHINDSMGHHIGDLLLKAVSVRLQNAIREGDTVARLGGDEFTLILEGVKKIESATRIAEKVLQSFEMPFLLDDKVLTISSSIGISLYPSDADDTTSLIKYADTAMYHAKSLGRNNFQFYTAELNQYATRHVQLEAGLKQAITLNELSLVYQPKFDVKTEKIIGLEALLRWNSAELGFISPAEFIPLAEETGMINEIGHWALNQACGQLSQWHQQGFEHISVAVNLSARQLKADIISTIEVALAVSGLPASALELELTESMIMGNPADSVEILTQLKAIGLTISIDDFGTGYSSLSYLKRFPIDTLKIDREFVRDITEDPDDAAITSAIITLAHSLELNVVAEGVETHEQLEFLRQGGCDQVQGFLLSKPLSVVDCLARLQLDKNSLSS
jgi:diguanylate cyclase (GGDEF)-like protein/PAS domain S-box-containing protein